MAQSTTARPPNLSSLDVVRNGPGAFTVTMHIRTKRGTSVPVELSVARIAQLLTLAERNAFLASYDKLHVGAVADWEAPEPA